MKEQHDGKEGRVKNSKFQGHTTPVNCRMHHPEDGVVSATAFVVRANPGGSAKYPQQLGEDLVRFDQIVAWKRVVHVSLTAKGGTRDGKVPRKNVDKIQMLQLVQKSNGPL